MPKPVASRAVYSTDGGRLCPQCQRPLAQCVCGVARPASTGDGIVRIRRETKGRGGKAVTVIEGIPEQPERLKQICKQLKQRCGVGGSVKGDTLEIQGDQRTICHHQLSALGYQVKLSGG
jgi:translation initiation factor 1